VIKSIRTSTGARIKIEDTVPGMKERAITVSALDRWGVSPLTYTFELACMVDATYGLWTLVLPLEESMLLAKELGCEGA